MQTFVRWILTLVVVFAAIPVAAGTIGFLDTDRAIKTVREGRIQYQALDTWASQRSDEVEAMQNRVAELTRQLESARAVASAEAIRQLENELLQAQRDFEDAARSLQPDFERKQRELLSEVAAKVRNVAGAYAEANGIDAIFMLESQPLVYVAESAVITDAVIRLYDERFPIE